MTTTPQWKPFVPQKKFGTKKVLAGLGILTVLAITPDVLMKQSTETGNMSLIRADRDCTRAAHRQYPGSHITGPWAPAGRVLAANGTGLNAFGGPVPTTFRCAWNETTRTATVTADR
jgi:hypothetical protein